MSFQKYKVVVYGFRRARMQKRSFYPIFCWRARVALLFKTTKKMRTHITVGIIALLLGWEAPARCQDPIKPYRLAGVFQFDFISKINHQPYRLTVALPFGYSAEDTVRYPTMYMMDGDPNLPLAALIQWNMTYDGEVPNMILVGVGYQADNFMHTVPFRTLDYTPTRDDRADSEMTAHHHVNMVSGGAGDFLRVIEEEIIPFIKQHYKTNNDQALAGHSFGGLFAAYVLFTHPELFQRYLISSPSLDWDNHVIQKMEARYAEGHSSLGVRVFISAGGAEPESMIPDVRALATTLAGRHYRGSEVTAKVFDDETHLSVIPFAISRGLRELYRR
jgi:predicted alpha/beta superfamily hydrolase